VLKHPAFKAALAPAGILLAAVLAFGLTLRAGFLWDDHRMIEQNPRISMSASNLAGAFKGDPFAQGLNYYRPLQTVSNMADFALWGLRPFGYHLTNLLFHAAAAILFFYLALALGFARPAAFGAAALLAAHPAAAEQLLVIAGRAELASGACLAASLLLFLKRKTAASFVFFLAACGFKENGVIMPALAALCLWYLQRDRREYRKLIPFLAFVPIYLVLRHLALDMGLFSHGAGPVLSGLVFKVPAAVLAYLADALLPFWMHSHRMQPDAALLRWAGAPLLAGAAYLLYRRGSRAALFCAGWYLLNLAPKFPLLAANDLMLNHWAYLSNAGLALWGAHVLSRSKDYKPVLAVVLAVLVFASAHNVTRRDSDLEIYEHAALRSSSKPMLYNLAREYYLGGLFQKSRVLLERINSQEPGNPLYLNGLALARWRAGDVPGALAALDAALAAGPGNAETLFNRYTVLSGAGRSREAALALYETVKLNPGYPPGVLAVARAAAASGRGAEAEALYRRVLAANPADLEALNDYGVLLAARGEYAAAEKLFHRALDLSPGLESAARNLARARRQKAAGRPQ
jgi:Flp pilus assembly protein TadD